MNYDQEPYFKNIVNTFCAPFLFSDTYMPKGSECGRFPQRRARCCTELFDLPIVVFSTPKETKKPQKKRGRGVSIASATIGVAVGFPTKVRVSKNQNNYQNLFPSKQLAYVFLGDTWTDGMAQPAAAKAQVKASLTTRFFAQELQDASSLFASLLPLMYGCVSRMPRTS